MRQDLSLRLEQFKKQYVADEAVRSRIAEPPVKFIGDEIMELAVAALLQGENVLLSGGKATGKNILADNLAWLFRRPVYTVSFHVNTDSSTLIGTDTFKNGEVTLRRGPIYQCAVEGGFGVLDEINMAKNESLSVLHATLDFRRIIDVPGYDRIDMDPATRLIATMNYGYAGTRELNEALASRFMVINMPVISADSLEKLLKATFPKLRAEYARQLAELFQEIRKKCDSSEISTKALDLRGLIAAVHLTEQGLSLGEALEMGILNKSFDDFERQLVSDIVGARIPGELRRGDLFEP